MHVCVQGLLSELQKEEQGFLSSLQRDEQGIVQELQKEEKTFEAELAQARAFVERIERQYTLPPWLRWLYNLGFPMPSMQLPTGQPGQLLSLPKLPESLPKAGN